MKTRTLFLVSAAFWVIGAAYMGSDIGAALAIVAHYLGWMVHRLEVKVNRLLDQQGIYVREQEFDN